MSPIVLIHGAYQGGWIWNLVARELQSADHRVFTPTLDGCGDRAHQLRPGIDTESQADEIVQLLDYYDLDQIVLAATSAGGMVMARVAELARDKIERVVFVDALALLNGEKIRDLVTQPAAINTDLGLGPTVQDATDRLLADVEPELRDWAARRFTLHPHLVFHQPVVLNNFWEQTWDARVIYCNGAANPGEAHIRRTADLLKGSWHELDTGHYPMLTMPATVASIIADKQPG
jgi:pimeloyl-ACP methyl ester carboxylesterase